jgi:hypothetical protein
MPKLLNTPLTTMLTPELLRTLDVLPAQHPRGQAHLSAASGLVCLQAHGRAHCYVVADDEHHLGHFIADDTAPVELMRLLPGDLPEDKKQRKRLKPDLECLVVLPAMAGYPQGALLMLGSGSKEARHTGLLVPLNAHGLVRSEDMAALRIDLTALYSPLHAAFKDLNIEGCFLQGEHVHLLQRGNKGDSGSACIRFESTQFQAWLLGEQAFAPKPVHILKLDLGDAQGIPLTPTDGIALPDGRWLLSAAAENTDNSFTDGPCAGSALALLDAQGKLLALHTLQGAPKIEGIALCQQGNQLSVLMVTDADDPELASQLLSIDAFW